MPAKGVLLAEIADVIVAGGGVIGTAIAWRAAAAGLDVVLVDPDDGRAASLVAAGMLAPASEALFGEGALLRLNLLAVRRFGSFAAELEEATGDLVGLRREWTLAVGRPARRGTGQPGLPQAGAVPDPGCARRRAVRGRLVRRQSPVRGGPA
jgi:glycine/D-amino acid oxidase-like deaminating enzyme